jgi:hypothetical protein
MGWEDGNKIKADKEKTKACDLRLDCRCGGSCKPLSKLKEELEVKR